MFTLTIDYDEAKDILKVEGPIKNAILCYGMLERARDIIKDTMDQRIEGKSSIGVVGAGNAEELLKTKIQGSA